MTNLLVAGRGDADDPIGGLFRFVETNDGWSGRKLMTVPELSSLAAHPRLPVVYGTSGDGPAGRLRVWRIDAGSATESADMDSGGAVPCFVCVHPSGRLVIVVNYTSGSLAGWRLDDSGVPTGESVLTVLTGPGGDDPARQDGPHPHQAVVVQDRLLVPDLGSDLIRVFGVDEFGIGEPLDPWRVPSGTGPRHVAIAPDGTIAVSGELAESVVFPRRQGNPVVASTGLTAIARSRPPRNYPGDLKIGRQLGYVANRGHDTIGVFSLGEQPGLIAEVPSGVRWPQHLLPVGDRLFVAGWDSSEVVSLPLGADGIPGEAQFCFHCPGAAWLVTSAV